MEWGDVIGGALDIYKTREQAKINDRLSRSQVEIAAYDAAARSSAVNSGQAVQSNSLLIVGGLGLLAVLAYVALK